MSHINRTAADILAEVQPASDAGHLPGDLAAMSNQFRHGGGGDAPIARLTDIVLHLLSRVQTLEEAAGEE